MDLFDRPATENQIKFIRSLCEQYDTAKIELQGIEFVPTAWGPLPETFDEASRTITKGKAAVAAIRAERDNARTASRQELVEGFYTDSAGERFWKVQRTKHVDGDPRPARLYAKVWDGESFEYDPSAIRDVIQYGHQATLEEASAFGVAFGTCAICGRLLTNPESVERGIGPVCAERF